MTIFLACLVSLICLAVLYAIVLRPWLKQQPFAAPFFAAIEPLELALFKKSETILLGRLLWAGGLFVTAYDSIAVFASSLDLTPITTRLFDGLHIPPDMRGLTVTALIALIGRAVTWLRAHTTKPLELVAIRNDDVSPAAAVAIARADEAKAEAVAVVAKEG